MSSGYYYLITSSVFLIVMFSFYLVRKSIPDLVDKLFEALLIIGCLTNITGLICVVFEEEELAVNGTVTFIAASLFYSINCIGSFLVLAYVLATTGRLQSIKVSSVIGIAMPAMVHVWLVAVNPETGCLFKVSESGTLLTGEHPWMHYVVPILYNIAVMAVLFAYRNFIERTMYVTLFVISGMMLLVNIVSCIYPGIAHTCVTDTAVIIILYLSSQNFEKKAENQTKMFNSAAFVKFCQQQLAERRTFYFLGIRIRNMRTLNRMLGVDNCDKLTAEIGSFLYHIPERCMHFRISNNTYAIVTQQPDRESAILKTIEARFDQTWKVAGLDVKAEISISSMEVPRYATSLEGILNNLEYCASIVETDSAKGNFICVDDRVMREIEKSLDIENAVKNAIENRSFEVVYQPIYSVSERRTTGAEALVRLYDEKLGSIPPDVFIPLAEKNGSILKIDRIVFENVCRFISENKLTDYGIEEISVNLSTVECMQGDLGRQLISTMDDYGVPHNMIRLEITETAAVNSYDRLRSTMEEISNAGCTIALDDYGTGYSNLDSILRFPFGVIKLDRSLVWTYDKNPHSAIILSHIEKLARKLDMKVLAEGVETEDHKNLVENIGVDFIQGFYFSRPLKESYFIGYLKNSKKLHRKN